MGNPFKISPVVLSGLGVPVPENSEGILGDCELLVPGLVPDITACSSAAKGCNGTGIPANDGSPV